MTTIQQTFTTEQFFEFAAQHPDRRFELHHGVLVEMPGPGFLHGFIVGWVVHFLNAYLLNHPIGYVVSEVYDFVLDDRTVYKPDVAFIQGAVGNFPQRMERAPEIAVEVVSPANTVSEMAAKVENYLHYGSQEVWIIYPDEKTVRVYESGSDETIVYRTLSGGDVLTSDVLPDYTVAVQQFFPETN
jgi:Uma2 family endonuclease